MKYINNVLTRLKLFILSPLIFALILSLAIFIVNQICFGSVNLCDDDGLTLYQLKIDLNNRIAKFNNAIFSKEMYYTSYQELMHGSHNSLNLNAKQFLLNNIERSSSEMNESLEKICELEKSIKKIDPNHKFIYPRPNVGKYI
jgi:hypothetical protein